MPDQEGMTAALGAVSSVQQAVAPRMTSHVVTREEIRRFSVAIGATDDVHYDVEDARSQGFRDLLAPPFYFATLGLSLGRVLPSSQLRPDGMALTDELAGRVVAGGSSIEWHGPIVAGDEIVLRETLDSTYEKAGRSGKLTFYVYTHTYTVNDAPVVVERLTRIGR